MRARVKRGSQKEARLNIRASLRQKELIARAAHIEEKTVSDFVLDNAYQAAKRVIADQAYFSLSKDQWGAFCAALDAPPKSISALRKLLTERGIFDER